MRRRYLKVLLQIVVLGITAYFLGLVVVGNWQTLRTYRWSLEPTHLAASFAALLLATAFPAWLWQLSLLWLGERLTFAQALRIWLLSNLVRYVPGNVWQFLSMIYLGKQAGVSQALTLTSIVISQALSTISGLLIGGLYWLAQSSGQNPTQPAALLLAVLLGLAALHPAVMERALNWALALLGRPAIAIRLSFGQILLLLVLYGLHWLLYGLAFHQLAAAITPFPLAELPRAVALFAAAYTIGFLSLLTPSGLGVRESALALLLSSVMPLPLATVVSLAARLWLTLGEVLGAGLMLLWPNRPQREVEDGG